MAVRSNLINLKNKCLIGTISSTSLEPAPEALSIAAARERTAGVSRSSSALLLTIARLHATVAFERLRIRILQGCIGAGIRGSSVTL
jgi:hypothetical protein